MGNKWNEMIMSSPDIEDGQCETDTKIKIEETMDYVNSPSSPIEVLDGSNEKKYLNLSINENDGLKCDISSGSMLPPAYEKISSKPKTEKSYRYNPKPLGRKNNRSFVPEERKTEDYWQKRIKNNVAARKSREDRRIKELEILNRKVQYEKENLQLRLFIEKVQSENQYLIYEINMLRSDGRNYPKY